MSAKKIQRETYKKKREKKEGESIIGSRVWEYYELLQLFLVVGVFLYSWLFSKHLSLLEVLLHLNY